MKEVIEFVAICNKLFWFKSRGERVRVIINEGESQVLVAVMEVWGWLEALTVTVREEIKVRENGDDQRGE